MKAAQITAYGGPDEIAVNDIVAPQPSAGQVLVEVYASSINPWDAKVLAGVAKEWMGLELPFTFGGDVAGKIAAVGDGVDHLQIGEEVYGGAGPAGGSGAFAEFAVTSADKLGPKPRAMDFEQAAAVALTGVSALMAIEDQLKIGSGQTILIQGGAGGIGSAAIQIAKHRGARVIVTATGAGIGFVKNLGADEVIDYKAQIFEDVVNDVDAVFDTVGGDVYRRSFKVLKTGGQITSMNEQPDTELAAKLGVSASLMSTDVSTATLARLREYIDNHIVTVNIDQSYRLDDIAEAFAAKANNSVKGKIAIVIKE